MKLLRVVLGAGGARAVGYKGAQGDRSRVHRQLHELWEQVSYRVAVKHCGLETVLPLLACQLEPVSHHSKQIGL